MGRKVGPQWLGKLGLSSDVSGFFVQNAVGLGVAEVRGRVRAFVLLGFAHEDERPLHVHRRRDELKMAGVAREPQIADAAHPVPALHRGEGALDARADAGRPGVEEFLPGLERIAGVLDLPGDPIDEAATSRISRRAWLS